MIGRAVKILLFFLFTINVAEGLFAPVLAVFITKNILGATLATVGFSVAIYSVAKSIAQLYLAKGLMTLLAKKMISIRS